MADHQQAAQQHDSVDRVRTRHQRRVQHRRHFRDHLETDEDGQHEDRDLADQAHTESPATARSACGPGAPISSLTRSLTIRPSWVTQQPATISSSKSSVTRPSSDMWSSRFARLLAYSRLAWKGSWLGRLSVPSIRTPPRSTTAPGSVSAQLPPVSAARSTITDPGRIERTISSLTSFGAGRPGTAAVVITQSAAATR